MDVYKELLDTLPAPGAGLQDPAPRRMIEVRGPDAVEFLHRLCSQDVQGMSAGEALPAAFLTGKGRLVATAELGRGEDRVFVEVQDQAGDELAELLERYHFSEELTVEPRAGWVAAGVLGRPEAIDGAAQGVCIEEGGTVRLAGVRRGIGWMRVHGSADDVSSWTRETGAPELDPGLAECLRILAGEARIGTDTDASTLPLEALLDDHISTTKGCYTGQEIVARIHTYGHVNRELSLLHIAGRDPAEVGATLANQGGDPVGRVMSAAAVPGRDHSLGLGYLPRELAAPGTRLALGDREVQVLAFAQA